MKKNSTYNEAEVLRLLSQGSEYAFTQLYDRYKARVFATAVDYLKSREHAQEILQEVFLKVWTMRRDFAEVKSPEAFIFTMARNHIINDLKKLVTDGLAQFQYAVRHSRVDNTIEHPIMEHENELILEQILHSMPPQQRKIYCMSRIDGLSHIEIANQLNISRWTVNKHIDNALKFIRLHLDPHLGVIALPVLLRIFDQ